MNYKYILDSSAWIEFASGSSKGDEIMFLIENQAIATSIITIAELADKFERSNRNFEEMFYFLKIRAQIIPLSEDIAISAGKLKKEIRAKNEKFGLMDGIHLATAFNEQASLITIDNDFNDVENVILVE